MKFSIFAPIQFLNYWILQRGVLGEEFFFGQKISYKIKVQHLSFTSHFQPLINMKYSFEQIHPKNARKWPNLQNPPLQIIFQIWSEKIENLNFLKQILQQSQNASSSETRPLSPVFSHTYLFTIVWELLKISIFLSWNRFFLTSKCLNYLKTPSFRPNEFPTRSSFGK